MFEKDIGRHGACLAAGTFTAHAVADDQQQIFSILTNPDTILILVPDITDMGLRCTRQLYHLRKGSLLQNALPPDCPGLRSGKKL